MLCSSRLVGGVQMERDALDIMRTSAGFSIWTVMLDSVDDVDVGDSPRVAMARVARRERRISIVVFRRGGDAIAKVEPVRRIRGATAGTLPKYTRCTRATTVHDVQTCGISVQDWPGGLGGRRCAVQWSGVVICERAGGLGEEV